ncbi:hypothetical protein [Brevundimonas sp.]|uniref:hypothetical protein n=1 Tax=Brevundimonas sp. TaxID=1871086 RepID=UPI003BABC9BB
MDGKRGQGDEDGAAGVGWLSRMITVLEGQAESALTTMVADVLTPGDTVGADRKARAVTNVARAVRAIEILRPRPEREPPLRRTDAATAEDSMNEDDDDSVDPAEFARARAELERRLDGLQRAVETKRLDGWPLVPSDLRGDGDDAAGGDTASPD